MIFPLLFLLIEFCSGQIQFASYYSDGMVLQAAPERPIVWGTAPVSFIGQTLTLTVFVDGSTEFLQVDIEEGRQEDKAEWKAMISAREVGKRARLVASLAGSQTIQVQDIVFGDVWFCSGQSNMAHVMRNIIDPSQELDQVENFQEIRTISVARRFSDKKQYDVLQYIRKWARPSRSNIESFSAVCWLFAKRIYQKTNRPQGLILSAWGGTRIEAWSSPEQNALCDNDRHGRNQNTPTFLYNAMVHPFLRFTIKGVLWYQGEANVGNPAKYVCQQKSMIEGWRKDFNNQSDGQTSLNFPFGLVQLAPHRRNPERARFPSLRWAQTHNFGYTPNSELRNVFMSVAMDLPDFNSPVGSIHPRYKRAIGERLALGAFKLVYNLDDEGRYQGPFPTSITAVENEIEVTFDNGNVELIYKEADNADGFHICCSSDQDGDCSPNSNNWVQGTINIKGDSSLTVQFTCVDNKEPTMIRYSWNESPCPDETKRCPVYSKENDLPVPPFLLNISKKRV